MAKQLKVELAFVDKFTKGLDRATGKIRRFGTQIRQTFSRLATLRNALAAVLLFKLGQGFVSAASKMEVFQRQLLAVSDSAEKADKALSAIRKFAAESPLETEDVVRSYVRLRAVGIDPTLKQMRTIGGVAVLMGREMQDVLDGFVGLNKRTLRALGVEIDRTGSKAILSSGDTRKVVEKDSASIRRALLEIWEKRFPNAIEVASDTFSAQMAIMRSQFFELQASLGSKLLPVLKRVVKEVTSAVKNLGNEDSGLNKVFNTFLRVMQFVETTFRYIKVSYGAIRFLVENIILGAKKLSFSIRQVGLDISGTLLSALIDFRKTASPVIRAMLDPMVEAVGGFYDKVFVSQERAKVGLSESKAKISELSESVKNDVFAMVEAFDSWNQAIATKPKGIGEGGDLGGSGSLGPEVTPDDQSWRNNENAYQEHMDRIDKITIDGYNKVLKKQRQWKDRMLGIVGDLAQQQIMFIGQVSGAQEKAARISQIVGAGVVAIDAAVAAGKAIRLAVSDSGNYYEAVAKSLAAVAQFTAMGVTLAASVKRQKFARGTLGATGGTAITGEEGPELIDLPPGARVRSAAATRSFVQNNTTNSPSMVFNIQGNADSSTVDGLNEFGNRMIEAFRLGYINPARLGLATA